MLTISARSTRSAQRSSWKLIDEGPEAVLSPRFISAVCGKYVTAIPARSTRHAHSRLPTPGSHHGATRVAVNDAHGGHNNLLQDQLDPLRPSHVTGHLYF